MIHKHSSHWLGLMTLALTAATAWGSAHAAVDPSRIDQAATVANQKKMAACKNQFITLRDVCAAEAGYGEPVPRDMLSPAQHQVLARENTRYQAALAACKGLSGDSPRTICMSEAGNDAGLTATN